MHIHCPQCAVEDNENQPNVQYLKPPSGNSNIPGHGKLVPPIMHHRGVLSTQTVAPPQNGCKGSILFKTHRHTDMYIYI